ncbi:Band 7 [Venustampulla echinocandica]|uniref:Band 7 n=1 Tax=Venustampulla echinocandica TaxID=2656787 RepID=A0A370TNH0_9HELO|nr:Band 7 [Venustampulla echinocandica]RDL37071.1 Band 7 [Venustampulla echinocandica]
MVYTIASPDEYLAITGAGVRTVKITKSAWVWPFQRCQRFSIQPRDYNLNLQTMTREKLQFLLPVVFTVGPYVNQKGVIDGHATRDASGDEHAPDPDDRGDALLKYAMLLAEGEATKGVSPGQHIENIVKGIIEGETRVLVSSLTIEEIFTAREEFKKRIFRNIQSELGQFGLKIYNANVKELRDAPQSSYFESLSRKAHEGAINQARIDVAEAQRRGNVGEAQRQGEQNREIAKINAETAVQKTERDSERAQAEATLATRKTVFNRDVNIAQIEATRATESRDEELRKEVEVKRAFTELERLRASDVVKATIARESKQQAADAKAYEEQAQAKASFFSEQQAADAAAYKLHKEAEAKFYATTKEAEAHLVQQQKEAAGISAMAGAYSDLSLAFGGPAGLIQYLMIEKGVYTQLAHANADAIRGLNPKMTIWNTGAQAGSEGGKPGEGSSMGGVDQIRNMYQMLPPLMSTINEQTGITLPEWQFGKLAGDISEREVSGKPIQGMGSNGTSAQK